MGDKVTRVKEVGDSVVAMGSIGSFCAEVVINEFAVYPMPDGLDFTQAASIGITYFTSYYALKQRAEFAVWETMLVLGA